MPSLQLWCILVVSNLITKNRNVLFLKNLLRNGSAHNCTRYRATKRRPGASGEALQTLPAIEGRCVVYTMKQLRLDILPWSNGRVAHSHPMGYLGGHES